MRRSSFPLFGDLAFRRCSPDGFERRFRRSVTLHFEFDQVRRAHMNDAQVNEIKRHAEVVAEALHRDIRQIAEGHSGIQRELPEMRDECRDEFKEMPAP